MSDPANLPDATLRFVDRCQGLDIEEDIRILSSGTKTAVDAARAVGCRPSQIVKSLVFELMAWRCLPWRPGTRRLIAVRMADIAGGRKARRASLNRVREKPGV